MTAEQYQVGNTKLLLIKGDITDMETDAIVNAANSTLLGGGGVDGTIHRRGGRAILEECKQLRAASYPAGLPTGQAVITGAGNLKAKYVIHTVGPIWHGGGHREADLLRESYENSLRLAVEKGVRSVAFPSISTGAYGYPAVQASEVALQAIKQFLLNNLGLDEVVLVLFSEQILQVYLSAAKKLLN